MEMERRRRCYGGDAVATVTDAVNLVVQSAFVTEKSIHWLLFLIGSVTNNAYALSKLLEAENRFPFSDLKKVTTPDAECKDDSETEDDSDDDDDGVGGGDDSDNDAEDSSGEEDNDNEQKDADSDSNENDEEDDDDNDEDDDDDSDEDDDDEDDDDEDEEEDNQPPFKKKK